MQCPFKGKKKKALFFDSNLVLVVFLFFFLSLSLSLSLSLQNTVASSPSKEEQTHVVDDEPKIGQRPDGVVRRAERYLDHNERQQHQQFAQGETPVVHSSSSAQQQEEAERGLSVNRIFQLQLITRSPNPFNYYSYSLRAFVGILFLCVVFLVGFAHIYYTQHVLQRAYFDKFRYVYITTSIFRFE